LHKFFIFYATLDKSQYWIDLSYTPGEQLQVLKKREDTNLLRRHFHSRFFQGQIPATNSYYLIREPFNGSYNPARVTQD
jgi:hypothetical protein